MRSLTACYLSYHLGARRTILTRGWYALGTEKEITELGRKVAALETNVENLNGWQKTQNGALLRVDEKVDKLKLWIIGLLATSLAGIFINLVKG